MVSRLMCLLAALLLPAAALAAPTPAPVQMPHISVLATGTGSPVILIPGLSSPRAVWDGVTPALVATHRVYLVQINGFGGDAPGANLKPGVLDGSVAELSAFIAHERLGAPAVVGHSLGGLVALMLARAHPEQVGRLMLVDTLPFVGTLLGPNATVATLAPRATAIRAQMIAAYGKPAPEAARATAASLAAKPESRDKVAAWVAAADTRVAGEALYEDFGTDLRGSLAAITMPITLVYPLPNGVPRERVDALYHDAYRAAPHVQIVGVADSAHFVMLDQPEAFQAALTAFLAR